MAALDEAAQYADSVRKLAEEFAGRAENLRSMRIYYRDAENKHRAGRGRLDELEVMMLDGGRLSARAKFLIAARAVEEMMEIIATRSADLSACLKMIHVTSNCPDA